MKKQILFMFLLMSCIITKAQVRLQPLFTDNMVLQQQAHVPIWGEDKAGKEITIITSWDNHKYKTITRSNGSWKITVTTPKAGGPYEITFNDGNIVKLKNVLIGEVWLCSGQSNMEMPIVGWGNNYFKEEHKEADNHPNIRLLQVNLETSSHPQTHFTARNDGWMVCNYENLANFSATAYFFGRDLEQHLNVPIGLIQTCWGGTTIEAWTGKEALKLDPDFIKDLKLLSDVPSSKENALQEYKRKKQKWQQEINEKDTGMKGNKAIWASPKISTNSWKTIQIPSPFSQQGLDTFDGFIWIRRIVDIPSSMTGKDLTLKLGPIDDNDITYFNGIEIGKTEGWDKERIYKIPSNLVKPGKNVIAIRIFDRERDGGLYGDTNKIKIEKVQSNPLDSVIQEINLSGKWLYKISKHIQDIPNEPINPNDNPCYPTVLYNAMINPLIPYTIKGVIWYQGEANANRAYQYRRLLPLMINNWHSSWGYKFPFYIVQLANFMEHHSEPTESTWAELREAQQMATNLDNTGISCTIDIGMEKDIHPSNKQDVGHRLALIARAKSYNENIEFSGPTYKTHEIKGDCIRIYFDHTKGGLKTKDNNPITGFAIAGPDKRWYWAHATIEGNCVIVKSDNVKNPIAVRYAWADNPICNLYNGENLPAFPFRTDNWNGITYNKK
ncbi:sialate O-acetylesterase [Hoylesella nanceiensis]